MKTIPQIGLGTLYLTGEKCSEIVSLALTHGYTHIDTAQIYENEKEVGNGIKQNGKKREEIWLTTKVYMTNYSRLKASVEESLQNLQTEYLDLLLLHRPTTKEEHEKCFTEMKELKQEGKIKNFGISNFTLDQMKHAREYTNGNIFTNQIEYHVCLGQKAIQTFADQHNIQLTAYSPLGHGNLLKNQEIQSIAKKHNTSVAQICIAWMLHQNAIVIPKTSSLERLQENLESKNIKLDQTDTEILRNLPKNHRYINPPFAPQRDQE